MSAEVHVNSARSSAERALMLPHRLVVHFWGLRWLIWRLGVRDMLARYRGSYLGLVWVFVNPLFLLAIYTFVFGFVFRARWGKQPANMAEFAMMLLCGVVPFSLFFADAVGRAAVVVVGQPSYVKRVVFPLEALPGSTVVSSMLQVQGGFAILLAGALLVRHTLHVEVLLVPILVIPLVLLTSGLTFFLASVGVFVRDMSSTVGLVLTLLFFMSPVFYRVENLPQRAQPYMKANPLTPVLEGIREAVMNGGLPDWGWWALSLGVSALTAYLGSIWFLRTKKAFADVL